MYGVNFKSVIDVV